MHPQSANIEPRPARGPFRRKGRRPMPVGRVLAVVALLIAGFGGAFIGSLPARAAAFGVGDAAVVIDGRLNLRTAPGLSADILAVLDDGARLTIVDGPDAANGYSWYEVSFEGDGETVGWVAGEFLSAPAAGDGIGDGEGVRTDARLNLRAGPGTDSVILEVLDDGALAVVVDGPIDASGYTWYKIHSAAFGDGWVAGEFLVRDNGASDCANGACPGTIVSGDTIEVDALSLNFRDSPSLSASVITVLPEGETAIFTGASRRADGIDWIEVETNKYGRGWVARQYVIDQER